MNLLHLIVKPAYAVITNPLLKNGEKQVTQPVTYFSNALQAVVTIFFVVGVIYFLWHLIMSAYHMISSQGDAKKFEEARNGISFALVGIVITFSIFAILKFVGTILGINGLDDLTLTLPTL